MPNEAEIERWNGPIGERWAELQGELDERLGAFGESMLDAAAVQEGERVLDIGCGCGETIVALSDRLAGRVTIVGVDVSKPMLARASDRTASLGNVTLALEDASTFEPHEPFDVAVSRFGVMFFEEPAAAFTNIRKTLKPGGRLAFTCWRSLEENPWSAVPLSGILRVVPPPAATPPHAPGPWAFADADRVRGILSVAGFDDITITPYEHAVALGANLEAAMQFTSQVGPASRALQDADAETKARAIEMLRQTIAPLAPSFELAGRTWNVVARTK